jgi:hypothetical protein
MNKYYFYVKAEVKFDMIFFLLEINIRMATVSNKSKAKNKKMTVRRIVMKIHKKHTIPIPKNYDSTKAIPALSKIVPIKVGFATRQRLKDEYQMVD